MPVSRRCLLATIFGSKLESRSRGMLSSTGPASVSTVLPRCPLREFLPLRPAGSFFIAQVIVQLALQGALDHHLGQPAQQPALAGQLQPAGAGPPGKLAQNLLISRRQLRSTLVLGSRHVSHWCLLHLRSYTVGISAPSDQEVGRGSVTW